jgi:hypothetical protein
MAVEDINVIDVIAEDPDTGEIVLLMHEPRAWKHGDLQLFQLQEKLNAYLSFALDGEMTAEHPEWAHRPLRVQLDCAEAPGQGAELLLSAVRGQIAFQGIKLHVRVIKDTPARGASSCRCGESCEAGTADQPPSSTFQ